MENDTVPNAGTLTKFFVARALVKYMYGKATGTVLLTGALTNVFAGPL